MLGALGGGSDLACGGKKNSKSSDLFCTGLWPYDWGHVMGQASSGPQPFTGSLELNGVVVVLSFSACVCVSAGESWKGCLSLLLISCLASLFSWLTETGACVEGEHRWLPWKKEKVKEITAGRDRAPQRWL